MTAAHRIPQDAGPAPTSGSNLRLLPSAEDTLRAIERLLTAPNRYLYGTTDAFVVNTGEKTCSCAGCDALRAHGLTCAVCGFVGTPIVAPCSCVEMRRETIAYAKREIRRITAGDVRPLDSSLDYYHRVLGEAVAWPNRMCTPPAPGADWRSAPGRYCEHGLCSCPTCGAPPGETRPACHDSAEIFVALIRDVRLLLEARSSDEDLRILLDVRAGR